MSAHQVQTDFSRRFPRVLDEASRRLKARKILSVLQDALGDLSGKSGLDIGCAGGQITSLLGEHFGRLVGVDVDPEALQVAKTSPHPPAVSFQEADAMDLPFPDGSFDVVICNHIYEHVPSAERLLQEIHRVLPIGGVCYFSASNRLRVIEGHYFLPFLSWIPKPLAHRYLWLLRRGDHYHENHLTWWGLRHLVRTFRIRDYTARIIEEPERFASEDLLPPGSLTRILARRLHRFVIPLIPTFVWLLQKVNGPASEEGSRG